MDEDAARKDLWEGECIFCRFRMEKTQLQQDARHKSLSRKKNIDARKKMCDIISHTSHHSLTILLPLASPVQDTPPDEIALYSPVASSSLTVSASM
jgi:hypothetical protein